MKGEGIIRSNELRLVFITAAIVISIFFVPFPVHSQGTKHASTSIITSWENRIFCGYQGWFAAEGDGADLRWKHYSRSGKFEPGYCTIEYWQDTREMKPEARFETPFKYSDGSSAYVYSAYKQAGYST